MNILLLSVRISIYIERLISKFWWQTYFEREGYSLVEPESSLLVRAKIVRGFSDLRDFNLILFTK